MKKICGSLSNEIGHRYEAMGFKYSKLNSDFELKKLTKAFNNFYLDHTNLHLFKKTKNLKKSKKLQLNDDSEVLYSDNCTIVTKIFE